jgi:hypothetical protein
MIIPILLVILLTAGLSLGQPSGTSGTTENTTSPADGVAAGNITSEGAPGNGTAGQNATAANASTNLNYIWSVTGLEPEPVIMVLNQEGGDLYGAAKYEPDSGLHWNADVVGSIANDNVDLTLTAQVDKKQVTTKLDGFFNNASQTLEGKFTQVSGGKIADKGNFSAVWINPDTSSYTPAVIEETKPAKPAQAPAETANTTVSATTPTDGQTTQQPVQVGKKSYYTDVHEYADKIGPGGDLSGVPPGMGGSLGP